MTPGSHANSWCAPCLPTGLSPCNQAADGLEGVEQILMGHGDLIFLDLTMPEMDGYGVLETLRQEGLQQR